MSEVDAGPGFVANYPPFVYWTDDAVAAVDDVLHRPPVPGTSLGAYVHVPFCRKRCRFCYFKVFTEQPAAELRAYVDTVLDEAALYAGTPAHGGRELAYLYVGGGTPSYLSSGMITELLSGLRERLPLAADAELTYECEPGTVRPAKMEALVAQGVSRVSLGIETWDEALLELNGRAHTAADIQPAFDAARAAGVPQINVDLIAGMVGETDASWAEAVQRTIDLGPDSVTIYQLEIPRNTALARALRGEEDLGGSLADSRTRRRWATEAFEALQAAGYTMTSGYTAVRGDARNTFVYRDALWHGADMIPLGVSAFGQLHGVHLQNDKHIPAWREAVEAGRLPVQRAFAMTPEHRFLREWVLQLKLGRVRPSAFVTKHGIDPLVRFADRLAALQAEGMLTVGDDEVVLTWNGWMQVDRLLPGFFLPEHGGPSAREVAVGA